MNYQKIVVINIQMLRKVHNGGICTHFYQPLFNCFTFQRIKLLCNASLYPTVNHFFNRITGNTKHSSSYGVTLTEESNMINLLLKKEMTTAQVNWVFYLKNDSEYSFACNLNLVGSSRPYRVREFFLKGGECKLGFSVPVHFIDDHPKVEYEVYRYSTMGREGKHSGEVKIKARDFARKIVYVGDIASDCLKYPIWKESPAQKTKPALRFMEKEESSDPNYRKVEIYDTEEMLEFDRTLDLHIEKLVGDPSKINPKSAFLIQMNAYKTFLDKALRPRSGQSVCHSRSRLRKTEEGGNRICGGTGCSGRGQK
jgi:hypothetical protein